MRPLAEASNNMLLKHARLVILRSEILVRKIFSSQYFSFHKEKKKKTNVQTHVNNYMNLLVFLPSHPISDLTLINLDLSERSNVFIHLISPSVVVKSLFVSC